MPKKGSTKPPFEHIKNKIKVLDNGCWEFTGWTDVDGYGQVGGRNEKGVKTTFRAHRVFYEKFKGKIPEGLVIDHLCHDPEKCKLRQLCPHRRCMNPEHMRACTNLENMADGRTIRTNLCATAGIVAKRKLITKCCNGHEFTPENTHINKKGHRKCRACDRFNHNSKYVPKKLKAKGTTN